MTATGILAAEGFTVSGPRGEVKRHPASVIRAQAAQALRLLAGDLGMSPSARGGIKVPELPNDDDESDLD